MSEQNHVVETYSVLIHLAGDVQTARTSLRRQCIEEGLCVTLTPTEFVYTYGLETGVIVRLINYPRFPKTPDEIWERAVKVAMALRDDLHQRSCLVETVDRTEWFPRQETK